MTRESFVFYKSFFVALRDLPPDEYKDTLNALCAYALDGEETELTGYPKVIFELIRPQIDANNKKYENGKKGAEFGQLGGRPRKNPKKTPRKPQENSLGVIKETPKKPQRNPKETPNVNVNDNVNVNVNDNENSSRAKPTRFSPPTLQEIRDYIEENGYEVDAERFFDFYESKGWMVGKNKMKDWKAAVRTWSRDKKADQKKPEQKNGFSGANYSQRQTDYNKILGLY